MSGEAACWTTLSSHPCPTWFRDAKFGIYTHWGPYSVPAYGGGSDALCGKGMFNGAWYPRFMYEDGHACAHHHRQAFGGPERTGYKDLIPHFTAEKFDPAEWVELFKSSGARFVGPTAQLHDGFAMWDSKVNRWNCRAMGPQRDITGEFSAAARRAGLKFVTTFHHAYQWFFYQVARGRGYDLDDPAYEDLYVRAHGPDDLPDEAYHRRWRGQLHEVIEQYSPDLIWFDFCLKFIRDDYKRRFVAYFYERARARGQEVGIAFKNNDLPPGCGIYDLESGRMNDLCQFPWLTDTSIDCVPRSNWAYAKAAAFKSPERVIHNLVDIVSKNGQLLLNVGPRADGTIPDGARQVLRKVGEWLNINGEAIYNTRPWCVAGEGPTKTVADMSRGGHFNETGEARLCAHDLRFTTAGNAIYIICLGVPGDEVFVNTFKQRVSGAEIERVSMLGVPGDLVWRHDMRDGLVISTPAHVPSEYANAFKVDLRPA